MVGAAGKGAFDELARALGARLAELRKEAGLTQSGVAEAMAEPVSGRRLVQRLENGRAAEALLGSMVACLRAARARFSDLADVLDAYVARPVPVAVRSREVRAPKPRPGAGVAALSGKAWAELVRLERLERERQATEVEKLRKRASYWHLRMVFEHFLHHLLNLVEAPPHHVMRRRSASFGRKVFIALFRTRGRRFALRPERLQRARKWAGSMLMPGQLIEYIEEETVDLFKDMEEKGDLDFLPDEEKAREIMAQPRRRRIVTDDEICRAKWWKAYNSYATAWNRLDEQARRAGRSVVEQMAADKSRVPAYLPAVNWASRIGVATKRGSAEREKQAAELLSGPWQQGQDRSVLFRLFDAAVAVWDAGRKDLPPHPGPKPM
jgi:transcriptional regulator with XRE-family HTH domain